MCRHQRTYSYGRRFFCACGTFSSSCCGNQERQSSILWTAAILRMDIGFNVAIEVPCPVGLPELLDGAHVSKGVCDDLLISRGRPSPDSAIAVEYGTTGLFPRMLLAYVSFKGDDSAWSWVWGDRQLVYGRFCLFGSLTLWEPAVCLIETRSFSKSLTSESLLWTLFKWSPKCLVRAVNRWSNHVLRSLSQNGP